MRSRISVLCLVVTVFFVSAALIGADDASAFQKKKPSGGGKPPSTIDVLRLEFNDAATFLAGTARIVSDNMGPIDPGANTYSDRRIQPPGETCVTARFLTGGGTFIHLDSGANTGTLSNNCNYESGNPNPRTYGLEFPLDDDPDTSDIDESCACRALGLAEAGTTGFCAVLLDPTPYGSMGDPYAAGRISTSSLFKKKDKTATIDLMFRRWQSHSPPDDPETEAFVISSNSPLPIHPDDQGNPDVRRLESGEVAFRLTSLETGVQCPVIPFSLKIDFIKVNAPQGGS